MRPCLLVLLLLAVPPAQAAEPVPPGLPPLVRLLGAVDDAAVLADVLRGMHEALAGRRDVPMPDGWPAVYRKLAGSPNAEVRDRATLLAVQFGDPEALAALRRVVADVKAPAAARAHALEALVYKKKPELVPLLQGLLDDRALRGPAVRGLAAFADPNTARLILRRYPSFTEAEKADAVQTLASRPAYALALLAAVEEGQVPRRDLSAFTVRQMQGLRDKQVNERLLKVWGAVRPASQRKAALMARYKALLTPDYLRGADLGHGRAVFARTCASCHLLFGEGGKVGPELTGSQRANLDYVLENVLDPSAIVPNEYKVTLLSLKDGRVVTGIIKKEDDKVVTVQTPNEVLLVPRKEVEERTPSPLSMMPEGLLDLLKDEEVRDLVAYLASPTQVPLPGK
jgi:putative heme-binding domain-containing protein